MYRVVIWFHSGTSVSSSPVFIIITLSWSMRSCWCIDRPCNQQNATQIGCVCVCVFAVALYAHKPNNFNVEWGATKSNNKDKKKKQKLQLNLEHMMLLIEIYIFIGHIARIFFASSIDRNEFSFWKLRAEISRNNLHFTEPSTQPYSTTYTHTHIQ